MRRCVIKQLTIILAICIPLYTQAQQYNISKTQGFTLFELFTSEGCSSCPAADKTLADIQQQYKDKNVLVLGYHVDYWNSLGWKDVFSTAKNTERQEYYSRIFHLNGNYTPQVVVNGRNQFVGSDRSKILNAIREESKLPSNVPVQIAASLIGNKINVAAKSSSRTSNVIILCLVQKKATSYVKRGENQGHTLQHVNIVLDFTTLTASDKEQSVRMLLPAHLTKRDIFIAAFLQNKNTAGITGLNTVEIN